MSSSAQHGDAQCSGDAWWELHINGVPLRASLALCLWCSQQKSQGKISANYFVTATCPAQVTCGRCQPCVNNELKDATNSMGISF